jgi:hypothetical protein
VDAGILEVDPKEAPFLRLKRVSLGMPLTDWKDPFHLFNLTGQPGKMNAKMLTFKWRGTTRQQEDGTSPCRNYSRPNEMEPPERMTLSVNFTDPSHARSGDAYFDVWLSGFQAFHNSEKGSMLDEVYNIEDGSTSLEVVEGINFWKKWQFTWRQLIARAEYNFPPQPWNVGDGVVTGITTLELLHKPLPLRSSDQWLPK